MAAPKRKTACVTLPGRKDLVLQRFGSLKNFHRIAQPYIGKVLPADPYSLGRMLEGAPCTPEQAAAVEHALMDLIERPMEIFARLDREYAAGKKTFTLDLAEVAAIRSALLLDGEQNEV